MVVAKPRPLTNPTIVTEEKHKEEFSETDRMFCIIILMLSILLAIACIMSMLYVCDNLFDRCRNRAKNVKKFDASGHPAIDVKKGKKGGKTSKYAMESADFSTPSKKHIDIDLIKKSMVKEKQNSA